MSNTTRNPTFRYDENNNGVWTYKGIDIYEWFYVNYTIPGELKSVFTIGAIGKQPSFATKEEAMDKIDSES